jgi:hypothetical protein
MYDVIHYSPAISNFVKSTVQSAASQCGMVMILYLGNARGFHAVRTACGLKPFPPGPPESSSTAP